MVTHRGATKRIGPRHDQRPRRGLVAATREMAKLLGEEEFSALFHQGKSDNIQLSLVGDRALLTAIFDDQTTVGMVRLYAAEAAKRLAAIFRRRRRRRVGPLRQAAVEPDPAFRKSTATALDDLFGNK